MSKEINKDICPVSSWLKKINCEDLVDKFLNNGYRDLETISEITKEDLHDIGIVTGFAKTILTHASKLKGDKNKKEKVLTENETTENLEVEEQKTPIKRRKRCVICHNYTSFGHKNVCSGECQNFNECPTSWIEKHEEDHKRFKKEKEEEKKEQSQEKKKLKEEEKKRKKEETEQYKKIPLKSWKEFYMEKKRRNYKRTI